jgi:hypothetical protein
MTDQSDDPRDSVAVRELQHEDADARKAQRREEGRPPAEVRTVNDDQVEEDGDSEHAGYSGGNGINNG